MGAKRVKDPTKTKGKKKETKKKEVKVPEKKKAKVIEGVRGIVRVAEADIRGERKVGIALLRVKGVGQSLARAIPIAVGIDPHVMIGSLEDEQLKKLEDAVKNPIKYGIPYHMVNRRRDPQTGEDIHLVSSELRFTVKSDIDSLKKIRAYRGIRHELGLPSRGQRTRASFRKGKRVGVMKKGRGIARGGAGRKGGKGGGQSATEKNILECLKK